MDLKFILEGMGFIFLAGCACDKLKMILDSNHSLDYLRTEFGIDLSTLSSLPNKYYLSLAESQKVVVDNLRPYLQSRKEQYNRDEFSHSFRVIFECPEKNELRAKQGRIKRGFTQLESLGYL